MLRALRPAASARVLRVQHLQHLELPVLNEFMMSWLTLVPQPGAAKLRWEAILGKGCSMYSKVRWWSKAEIWFVMAQNFHQLPPFVRLLQDRGIGDATTKKMRATIYERDPLLLELSFAACMDGG